MNGPQLVVFLVMRVAVPLAFVSFANAQQIPAQPYIWKSVTVRGGGYVPGVDFSPAQKGLMYCRTDIGGCYRSVDSGNSWVPLNDWTSVGDYMGGESLAPDPVEPNVFYMAAGLRGAAMIRSRDGGKTFQVFPVPFTMGGNSTGRGVGERLAVDPNSTNVLYFGSRADGLWKSNDYAETWQKVESFPVKGGVTRSGPIRAVTTPQPSTRPTVGATAVPTNPVARRGRFGNQGSAVGLSFVIYDPASSDKGQPCRTIYVGNTDPGFAVLYRSGDAGQSWEAVDGAPSGANLKAARGGLDTSRTLYIECDNEVGPNSGAGGQVWKLDTSTGKWSDISPVREEAGAFEGLAIDHQHPGTLLVSTFNGRPEDVYRTTDGGTTWKSVNQHSIRDASISPFLTPLNPDRKNPGTPVLGWWMTGTSIDPFDSDHCVYTTGATIWGTHDMTKLDADQLTHWAPETIGMEETAIIYLVSPPEGPHLISGFGDIGSFTHDDFAVSPPMNVPKNTNCDAIDYAGQNSKVVVRNGNTTIYSISNDSGHTWKELNVPGVTRGERGGNRGGGGAGGRRAGGVPLVGDALVNLIVSADGQVVMALAPTLQITSDQGQTWKDVKGLQPGARVVSDKVNGKKFYALDQDNHQLFDSFDGGATFTGSSAPTLPDVNSAGALRLWATPQIESDLWATANRTISHSTDGGKIWKKLTSCPTVSGNEGLSLGFGKGAPGKSFPALYVAGSFKGVGGIWRSDDIGLNWIRLNDDVHQYGNRFRCIAGDPRIYGRVYVGTDGRGILYGDIALGGQ